MIANWKFLFVVGMGLACVTWFGPSGDTGRADVADGTELTMHGRSLNRSCTERRASGCVIDLRYAHPAAGLYVVPAEAYF